MSKTNLKDSGPQTVYIASLNLINRHQSQLVRLCDLSPCNLIAIWSCSSVSNHVRLCRGFVILITLITTYTFVQSTANCTDVNSAVWTEQQVLHRNGWLKNITSQNKFQDAQAIAVRLVAP